MAPVKLTFATTNAGKMAEAREALAPLGLEIVQWDGGYPELQADTLEEVASFGATMLQAEVEAPFFLEDAGLFVDALDGFPGVYSAYAFHTIGWEGVLRLLDGVPDEDRAARFHAVVAYHDGAEVHLFRGTVEGAIARQGRGEHGFGFDPVFVPHGHDRTFGEMTVDEKGDLSHRSRALEGLSRHLARRAA